MGELQKKIFCCIPWKNALTMTAVVERTVLRDGVLGGFEQTQYHQLSMPSLSIYVYYNVN